MQNQSLSEAMTMIDLIVGAYAPEDKKQAVLRAVHFEVHKAFAAGMAEQYRHSFNFPLSEHVTRVGGYQYDSLGGCNVTYFIVEAPDTDAVYERLADIGIKAEHCQHEYDCCGHWYGDSPKILQVLNTHTEYLVEWRQYQNV